jgi:REP element-mobilizing transposase RayT
MNAGRVFAAMDSILGEARTGPVCLRRTDIAKLVTEAIRYGSEHMGLYERHAWVVMPNHVHLLITPLVDPSKITHSIKRFTAREANKILGGAGGSFWQDESYDHLVRDTGEFRRIIAYIHANPVRAGLAADAERYPWSSATAD